MYNFQCHMYQSQCHMYKDQSRILRFLDVNQSYLEYNFKLYWSVCYVGIIYLLKQFPTGDVIFDKIVALKRAIIIINGIKTLW